MLVGNKINGYIGAAPNSEIIAVKLRKARQYFLNRFLVPPEQNNVFESTDIALGIDYIISKADELNRPVVICIGLGTNMGGHDGFSELEKYISIISNTTGVCVCTAAGNESRAGHHTNGRLMYEGEVRNIEIRVPENSNGFPVYIYNNFSDRFSVSVRSPTGESVSRFPAKSGTSLETNLVLERSKVLISYFFPIRGSSSQLTTVKITNPTPGIWTISLYGDIVLDGTYHAWLPITGLVTQGVEFLTPTPETTVVVPATSSGSITSGAYDSATNSLYNNSSWGPTRVPTIEPDLVAPGVNVEGIYPLNRGTMTGTSVATAITSGACALMLQWGFIEGNDNTLNSYRIRAFLIRGCRRNPNIVYPNYLWGYGALDLQNTLNQMTVMLL